MNSILSFLSPAPAISEITDKEKIKSDYKYWRLRILYSMFVGYALYYFTRKSFTYAMPGLITDLGFDKSHLGILGSVFAITYGISKFASGVLSDRSNARYFMALGLMITGILNIFFGLSSSLFMFIVFWGLNGWFQGFGWPPCARFLTHWYSQSERGRWWAIWNVSHNVGSFIIPWIVAICLTYLGGWRMGMYVPGVLCIFGSFFLINRLRDNPQSIGLPPIEQFRNDYVGVVRSEVGKEKKFSTSEVLKVVLQNRYLWMLGFAYFFVYVVRMGIGDWTALYLIEAKGYSRIGANGCVSLFEFGGFFGSLFAGWASDRIFGANRGPVNVLFSLGALLGVLAFWYSPQANPIIDSCALFAIGFSIFGPQMLIGMQAAELSPKQATATASGFVGCFAYSGAAIAGYPLGAITDIWGWNGFFWAVAIGGAISVTLLLPLWGVKENIARETAAA